MKINQGLAFQMNIIVTGADGFIGKRLCMRLAEKGHTVLALVKSMGESRFAKSFWHEKGVVAKKSAGKIHFLEANILDLGQLRKALCGARADCCIHLAGFSNNPRSPEEETACFSTNVDGTKNAIEALAGMKDIGFVFMSSAKVYGNSAGSVDESSPLLADDAYSKSKIEAEKAVMEAAENGSVRAIILRPSNSYGPGDLSFQRIIPGSLKRILAGEPPVVYGDGMAMKNFIFVGDTVEAIISAAENSEKAKAANGAEVINLSSGKNISIMDIEEILLMECGSSLKPLFLRDKKGESAPEISTRKAERLLGWRACTSIGDGLRQTVKWYRGHFEDERKIAKD
ncbi:GDP-L-fucose synthase [uncultured archaeon]|nr:GDP-L-fucose synthase [uncultured archaeon]